MRFLIVGVAVWPFMPASAQETVREWLTLPPERIQLVQTAIKDRLKDPESARFSGVKYWEFKSETDRIMYVCGFVNAKNSFGGYNGEQMFYAVWVLLTTAANM